ncbi:MAG: cupredoxin domain-containing protein [Alphaproteobacteria bacterium]|nr:cupredoxin domain-containing protein [Alphaproteobacteria bacterium]
MGRAAVFSLAVGALVTAGAAGTAAQPAAQELTISNHRFDPAELDVPARQPVTIHVRNLDPTPEEFDSSALKVEKVIGGNGEGTIHVHPLAPGRYDFMGEYHSSTARGVVVAK